MSAKFIVALAPPTSPPAPAGIQVLYATMRTAGQRPGSRPTRPIPSASSRAPIRASPGHCRRRTSGYSAGTGMPLNTQGGYSFHMAVDPASPGDGINDIIYFGAVPGEVHSTRARPSRP